MTDEMLTVPGYDACSWEHENVTGGSRNRPYASAAASAIAWAINVSVVRGR